MRFTVTDRVAWSVDRSVDLSVMLVSPAKTAEPIETPFGLRTRDMASTRARAYNGGLGRSPQRGSGAEPLVRGSVAALELKALKHLHT